jgi:hypothetical protein
VPAGIQPENLQLGPHPLAAGHLRQPGAVHRLVGLEIEAQLFGRRSSATTPGATHPYPVQVGQGEQQVSSSHLAATSHRHRRPETVDAVESTREDEALDDRSRHPRPVPEVGQGVEGTPGDDPGDLVITDSSNV